MPEVNDSTANATTGILAVLGEFSSESTNSAIFAERLQAAMDRMAQASDTANNRVTRNFIQSLARNANNPATQDTLRRSFDGIRSQIASTINASVDATHVGQINTLKAVLGDLGRLAGPAGYALSVAQINSAVDSGDPVKIGQAVASAVVGALAASFATAFFAAGGGVLLPVLAAGAAAFLVAEFLPELLPAAWAEAIGEAYQDHILDPLTDFFTWLDPLDLIPDDTNTDYNAARNWVQRRDPLALDLDGDGIETVGADGTVLFDHNGDGVKTGTGWVSGDDGFLVLDRNGNGVIDSGAELFGVDTIKSDGRHAFDGFDALRDLDNNGDRVFDANDAAFASVRIWQDLDQDGVTDAGELRSLSDAGIVSIDLVAASNNVNLGNGNVQTASAANLTTSGDEGTTANLDLADNPFFREFTDPVTLTEAALALPDMQGSGMVRDLREAMSLSGDLTATISAFAAGSAATQRAQIDTVIASWADTSTLNGSVEEAQARGFELVYLMPGLSGAEYLGLPYEQGGITIVPEELRLTDEERATLMAQQQQISHIIEVLEKFNGQRFLLVGDASVTTGGGTVFTSGGGGSGGGGGVGGGNAVEETPTFVALSQQQIDFLLQSYDKLKEAIYVNLAVQTRLSDYTSKVSLTFGATGGVSLDFSAVDAALEATRKQSPTDALTDLIELVKFFGTQFVANGWDGIQRLQTWISSGVGGTDVQPLLADLGVSGLGSSATASGKADVLFAGAAGGVMRGMEGNDTLVGGVGNDSLFGDAGDDVLDGGEGSDVLYGGAGDDVLDGGEGSDVLYGGAGDDVLRGGAGTNDYMSGDAGNDTYLFGAGDGNTTISNYDVGAGRHDVLRFLEGVSSTDVTARRSGNDLLLTVGATGEVVTVSSYFYQDGAGGYALDAIEFADGAAWGLEEITAAILQGSAGNDNMTGFATDDTLDGGAGDDTIRGAGGNDTLVGGAGNDRLYGDAGNDVLDGGEGSDYLYGGDGNDVLEGGEGSDYLYGGAGDDVLRGGVGTNDFLSGDAGNDTYLFGAGDGNTTISNYDVGAGRHDVLRFLEGVSSTDVTARRSGNDLSLTVGATGEVVTVSSYFYQDGAGGYALDAIEFADGVAWGLEEIVARLSEQAVATTTAKANLSTTSLATSRVSASDGEDGSIQLGANTSNEGVVPMAADDVIAQQASVDHVIVASFPDSVDPSLPTMMQKPIIFDTPPTLPPVQADDGSSDVIVPPVIVGSELVFDEVLDSVPQSINTDELHLLIDGGNLDVSVPITKPVKFQTPPTLPPSWPEDDALPMQVALSVPERLVSDVVAPGVEVDPAPQTVDIGLPILVLDGGDLGVSVQVAKPDIFQTPPFIPPVERDDGAHDLPHPPVDAGAAPAPGEGLPVPVAPIELPEFTLPSIDLDDLWTQLRLDGGDDSAHAPSPFDTPPLIVPHCQGASSLAHCNRLIELMAINDGFAGDVAFHEHRFDARAQIFTP